MGVIAQRPKVGLSVTTLGEFIILTSLIRRVRQYINKRRLQVVERKVKSTFQQFLRHYFLAIQQKTG